MIYYVVCQCGKCIVCRPPVKAGVMVECRHCGQKRSADGGDYRSEEQKEEPINLLEVK